MEPSPTDLSSPLPTSRKPLNLLPPAWSGAGAPPLEFDIGCHKGLFLVEMAKAYPERNFFGIERQAERVAKTLKKIQVMELANAGVAQADGFDALSDFPAACADHLHVLFPDPWPKRRHYSRRMVQSHFLQEAHRVLKPGGLLRLVTDDASYAGAMEELAAGSVGFERQKLDDREYPLTEFQRKFLADGRPVNRVLLRKLNA